MRESFLASIAFALLALFTVSAANLLAYLFTASPAHKTGAVVGILAMAVSYASQGLFTEAAGWLAHHWHCQTPGYAGPENPDAWRLYERRERAGHLLRIAAALLASTAAVLFLIGGPQ